MYIYPWLIHIVVGQKPTQHFKATILQLKINLKHRDFPGGPVVKNLPSKAGTWVRSLVEQLRPNVWGQLSPHATQSGQKNK